MRKMINKSVIEGTLVEKTLRAGTTKANVPYISGRLSIDTGDNNVVVVDVFEQQKTSKGLANGKYDTLSSIFKNGKALHDGEDNPTSLRVLSALELKDWMSDGQQRTALINNGGFVTIINNPDRKAQFEVDIVIKSVQEELRNGEEPTGRAIINGVIFNYRNHALPIKFVVENPQGVQFFNSLDLPIFTKIWGIQTTTTSGSKKTEQSAFGEAKVVQSGYTRKEFIVTGAQTIPYDDDQLTQDELKAAIQARNVAVAESLSNQGQSQPQSQPQASTKPKTGTFSF